MINHPPLQQLYHHCDPTLLGFQTTVDLDDMTEIIGQMRAMDAIRFGTGIRHEGYNIFVLGPSGTGKRSMVLQLLEKKADSEQEPSDWCYVNHFAHPHKPQVLMLPSGRGKELRQGMEKLVDYLRSAIPALFDSDEYHNRAGLIRDEFAKRQEAVFKELSDDAAKQEIALLRTPEGFALAPTRNHDVIPPDEYEKLPDDEKQRVEVVIAGFQARLEKLLRQMPQWRRERHERIKQLDRETSLSVIGHLIDELKQGYGDFPSVIRYLDSVQSDMLKNVDDFRKPEDTENVGGMTIVTQRSFYRYQVNVLVTSSKKRGAPIVSEDNPTYSNLVG
ncbi:MAG: ATP-binding protein, partial [Gallionella sp.]